MFVAHCGNCYKTPCECPRYYQGRVPQPYELEKLNNGELTDLLVTISGILRNRMTQTVTSNSTQRIPSPMSNPRATLSVFEVPEEVKNA